MLAPALALVVATFLALVPSPARAAAATPINPRLRGGWVTDAANLLTPEAERRIDARLGALARELGIEVAVVTMNDVPGVPKDYATGLFKRWGIGQRGADNGLLVLVVRQRRRVEIETGYGLEASLPDAWLGQMQLELMVPRFRRQDFGGGIEAALAAIDDRLRTAAAAAAAVPPAAAALVPTGPQVTTPRVASGASPLQVAPLALSGLAAGAVLPIVLLVRRRRRTCRACRVQMRRLAGAEADVRLDYRQRLEQQMGSVRHSVYQCEHCQDVRHLQRVRWFSGVALCHRCQCRALQTDKDTIQMATVFSGGLVRVRSHCAHCHHEAVHHVHTPALPVPAGPQNSGSSSDGGSSSFGGGDSGSSFGGGDSGGGGAGPAGSAPVGLAGEVVALARA